MEFAFVLGCWGSGSALAWALGIFYNRGRASPGIWFCTQPLYSLIILLPREVSPLLFALLPHRPVPARLIPSSPTPCHVSLPALDTPSRHVPFHFLSSEVSSAHQRLERRQTLLGLANSSSMLGAVSRFHLAYSSTPSLVAAASPLRPAASSSCHFASALTSFLFLWSSVSTLELPQVPPGSDLADPPPTDLSRQPPRLGFRDRLWSSLVMLHLRSTLPLDRVRPIMGWHSTLAPLRVASSELRVVRSWGSIRSSQKTSLRW